MIQWECHNNFGFLPYYTEIFEDTVIGKGAFCVVTEVQFMKLKGEHVHSSHSLQGADNLQIRSLVPDSYKTDENPKYALKRVKNKLIKEKDGTFVAGVVDLVMEARLLSCLQHKNIVKIHGTSSSHPCSDSYYIILEKLYDTLTDRMKEWKRNRRLGSFINLESTTVKGEDFLAKRLMVARDISNAISYLHSHW
jgi:serine/threonine protein kinase